MDRDLEEILGGLQAGRIIPYLGAGLLPVAEGSLPASFPELADVLGSRVTVPHKIRRNLTATAQYVENFRHRKTLVQMMDEAFSGPVPVHPVLRYLAEMPLPLVVHLWYDDSVAMALAGAGRTWGRIQGLSQGEHYGNWTGYWSASGEKVAEDGAAGWDTILYEPWGARSPASNYLVSDSDFVEVMTEIDIQTPIPQSVQLIRRDRHFLFLGCRFDDQLQRAFARQIMKRSSDRHWALFDQPLTRNEQRFLAEQNIQPLFWPVASLPDGRVPAVAQAG